MKSKGCFFSTVFFSIQEAVVFHFCFRTQGDHRYLQNNHELK